MNKNECTTFNQMDTVMGKGGFFLAKLSSAFTRFVTLYCAIWGKTIEGGVTNENQDN